MSTALPQGKPSGIADGEGSPSGKRLAGIRRPGQRNVWIDVCRLAASIIIMFFHFPIDGAPFAFESGALLVEYFFILTGYFAFRHVDRYGGSTREIARYMKAFYLRVLPFVIVGVTLEYASEMMILYPDWGEMVKKVSFLPFEFLLLQSSNIFHSAYHVLWYLSITMLCLPVAMYLYRRVDDGVWSYLVLIIPLLCYGLAMQTTGTLRLNKEIVDATRRSLGGIFLGGLTLRLSENLGRRQFGKVAGRLLPVAEILTLVAAGLLMTRPELEKTRHDSVTVFFLFCSLVISLSNRTWTSRIPSPAITSWLGPLSLSIYCLHYGVYDLMKEVVGRELDAPLTILGGLIVIGLSVVLVKLTKAARRWKSTPKVVAPAG